MQDEIDLGDSQIDAVAEFVNARTVSMRTPARSARAAYIRTTAASGAAKCQKQQVQESGMDGATGDTLRATVCTLPSDRACEVMRSRLAKNIAEHSVAAAADTAIGTLPPSPPPPLFCCLYRARVHGFLTCMAWMLCGITGIKHTL